MPWEWRLKNSFPRGSGGGGGGGGCEGTDERAYGGSGGVDDNWSDCDISDGDDGGEARGGGSGLDVGNDGGDVDDGGEVVTRQRHSREHFAFGFGSTPAPQKVSLVGFEL